MPPGQSPSPSATLSKEDVERNESAKVRLTALLKSGNAIVFVGAGVSIPVGYPSWPALVEQLEALAVESGPGFAPSSKNRVSLPLVYVDEIKGHILKSHGDLARYGSFLYRVFERKARPFSPTQSLLVQLPSKGLLAAPTAHHFMELLNSVIDVDPTGTLRMAREVAVASEAYGYNLDSLAIREVVKLVERVLADFRPTARESESLNDLLLLLDVFAKTGWPEAHRLIWRLDEAYR